MKNTAVLFSLTLVLVGLTGCNSKKGIESSKLGEKVQKETKVLGVEDTKENKTEKIKLIAEENKTENRSKQLAKPESFNKTQLKKAKERMKESLTVKTQIKDTSSLMLNQEETNILKLSYENLFRFHNELELQFDKYPNITHEDYINKLNIIDSMINEVNNMNKIQNNSDEFKVLLINTIEGLVITKNYIKQSKNIDITSEQAVSDLNLLKSCIDIYEDNMGDVLSSINDYVYSK